MTKIKNEPIVLEEPLLAKLLFAAAWLVLAWRTSGWIGLDRWLLPSLGPPWKPGRLFVPRKQTATA